MTPISIFTMISSCFDGKNPLPEKEEILPTSECEMPYVFDPESPPTAESLEALGADSYLLYAFSDANNVITTELATLLSLALQNVGDACKAQALFQADVPPNGVSAVTILGNTNGMALEPNVINNTHVVPEDQNSYADLLTQGFTDQQLSGIFFTDSSMDQAWQRAGNSVVQINIYDDTSTEFDEKDKQGHASGVLIALDESTILTAHHVLYEEDGSFSNTVVRYRGQTYPIREEQIVFQSISADLAAVRVPSMDTVEGLSPAHFASRLPSANEPVMAIGYAQIDERIHELGCILNNSALCEFDTPRLYSAGTYLGPRVLSEPHSYFEISNRLYFGDSGGALFNSDGELIGILSFIHQGETSYAGSLFPQHTPYPDFRQQLTELREASGTRQ